ncbi:MAG: TolB family protein [Anaerolineales bacterium]
MRRFTFLLIIIPVMTGCSISRRMTPSVPAAVPYAFRLQPPAVIEISTTGEVLKAIPVSPPGGCDVDALFAPRQGSVLAIELSCSFGQAMVWLNTASGVLTQPVTNSDSHFMAWTPDGAAAYLKVDSVNRPHIIRAPIVGKPENVPITELTYDIAPKPDSKSDFLFSFSRGMGLGSEMWLARFDGRVVEQVIADPHSYLSFARWSPDGSRIAFIKIPDSEVPFTVGGLWVMQADGSNARKLSDADAGHGFAEAWSPDGSRIAFIVRENATDAQADQNADALRSNVAIVNVKNGSQAPLTSFPSARVEAPTWSPDGNMLTFTVVLNDRMNVYVVIAASGEIRETIAAPACCPVWMRK